VALAKNDVIAFGNRDFYSVEIEHQMYRNLQ
jgi:hypothetical protein